MNPEGRTFPEGFLWGCGTAAHQVEGDNRKNDWWEFEQKPGAIEGGDRSGVACDHYRRFKEDFQVLKGLSQNAHRFSVEWSRIEPEQGVFDHGEIDHYRQVLTVLRDLGLEPMVTLHHFTSPLWFARKGGFTNNGSAKVFAAFVDRVCAELGDLCTFWCTLNEPNIYAVQGWVIGEFPPGKKGDIVGACRVLANMRKAHELAYATIKRRFPLARVGIAQHRWLMSPSRPESRADRFAAGIAQWVTDRWPVGGGRWGRVVEASSDFLGLNHYSGSLCRLDPRVPGELFVRRFNREGAFLTDMGWMLEPQWLGECLSDLGGRGKPVYITENGVATRDDEVRCRFLIDNLRQVESAISRGVDVRGYFYWTSMDNFEWAKGYAPQFGLVAVDRQRLQRSPRPSAALYAGIAASGRLPYRISPD
ncbi:MAG TPA: family 1 glycosylhydrolase [Candidatus Dormibacteraeota bacterium]|jgi:beta-glucosidase|nr:family 1 glycosylhydrolase [Candidatus Dormibacteraeota bacterium]